MTRTFLKYCGTQHTYQVSSQSDSISGYGILRGNSPPTGGEREWFLKKIKKDPLGIHPYNTGIKFHEDRMIFRHRKNGGKKVGRNHLSSSPLPLPGGENFGRPRGNRTYFPRVMRSCGRLFCNDVVDAGSCIAMMGVNARNCIIMMGVDPGSCIIMMELDAGSCIIMMGVDAVSCITMMGCARPLFIG